MILKRYYTRVLWQTGTSYLPSLGSCQGPAGIRPVCADLSATGLTTFERKRWQRYFGSMEFVAP